MLSLSPFPSNKQYEKAKKTDPKLTLHHMGKSFISELNEMEGYIF